MGNKKNKLAGLSTKSRKRVLLKAQRPLPLLPRDIMPALVLALQIPKYRSGIGKRSSLALRAFGMVSKGFRELIFYQQFRDMVTTPTESWERLVDEMPEKCREAVRTLKVVAPVKFRAKNGEIYDVKRSMENSRYATPTGFQETMWDFIATLPNLTGLTIDHEVGAPLIRDIPTLPDTLTSLTLPYPALNAYLGPEPSSIKFSETFPHISTLTLQFSQRLFSALRNTHDYRLAALSSDPSAAPQMDWDFDMRPDQAAGTWEWDVPGVKELRVNFTKDEEMGAYCGLKICRGYLWRKWEGVERLVIEIGGREVFYQGKKSDLTKHLIPFLASFPNLTSLTLHISSLSCQSYLASQSQHVQSVQSEPTPYISTLPFASPDISTLFTALSAAAPTLVDFHYQVITSSPKRKEEAWMRRYNARAGVRDREGPEEGKRIRGWRASWEVDEAEEAIRLASLGAEAAGDREGDSETGKEGGEGKGKGKAVKVKKMIKVWEDVKDMTLVEAIEAASWD